jgi:hydroxyacyl-ACP dehydratase HTD2-like protein with hotdog domain
MTAPTPNDDCGASDIDQTADKKNDVTIVMLRRCACLHVTEAITHLANAEHE